MKEIILATLTVVALVVTVVKFATKFIVGTLKDTIRRDANKIID